MNSNFVYCDVPRSPEYLANPSSKFSAVKLFSGKNKTAIFTPGLAAQCFSAFLILFGVAVSEPAISIFLPSHVPSTCFFPCSPCGSFSKTTQCHHLQPVS